MNGIAHTFELAKAFRHEQSDPGAFYRLLARDTVEELRRFHPLRDARVLDVGGASGYVGEALADAGAATVTVEYDREQIIEHGRRLVRGVQGDGCALPLTDSCVNIAYSSNVLEHVRAPSRMLEEMVRVVRPGGIVFVAYTNWLSPWGGHETSPWHYLGGDWAARRYERRYGHPPKNRFGDSLFPLHIGSVLGWATRREGVRLLDAFPRYYPRWTKPLVAVPGVREVATWNLVVVLRREP